VASYFEGRASVTSFENKMVKKIFGPKEENEQAGNVSNNIPIRENPLTVFSRSWNHSFR